MIYIHNGGEIEEILTNTGQPVTEDIHNAQCIVIEWPASIVEFESPVFIVVDGMVSWPEWLKIKENSYIVVGSIEELIKELNDFRQKQQQFIQKTTANTEQDTEPEKNTNNIQHENEEYMEEYTTIKPRQSYTVNNADILVSCSTAGGVGKTFWASNMGACIAASGYKTAVVDFDLWAGNIPNAFGLNAGGDILTVDNWMNFKGNPKDMDFLVHQSGVYIIPCTTEPGLAKSEYISGQEAEALLSWLSQFFDIVIIDLGNNPYLPHSESALELADSIFLIGGTDTKTIDKVSRFTEQEKNGERYDKIKLIINMVSAASYYKPHKVAKKFGFKDYDEIPLDERGVNAATRAKRLAVQLKGSISGDAVKSIVSELYPDAVGINSNLESKQSIMSRLKSFIKK